MKFSAILLALSVALPLAGTTTDQDIARITSQIDSVVGVAAVDLDTGRTLAIRGTVAFPMASVFKFPLAIEVLRRVDAGTLKLETVFTITPAEFSPGHSPIRDGAGGKSVTLTLRALIHAGVADSDNTAADNLLRMVTPAAVTAHMRALGAPGIRVDRTEKDIIATFVARDGVARYAIDPRDTATPAAAVALMTHFAQKKDGLSAASHEFLANALGPASKNPVRIARLLPAGTTLHHKTGTMPGTMNDVALITSADGRHHIVLAIFTKASKKSADADRERVIGEIGRLVFDTMMQGEAAAH